jgi:organic hydroperoxide reductase OsmC/OhrA
MASKKSYFANVFVMLALLFVLAGWGVYSPHASGLSQENASKMLRHVVMFQFKDSSSREDVQKVVDAFRSLKSSIAQVASFEHGTNNSPEGLANGITHCFLITFKSEADREIYLKHPRHDAFVEILKPHLEKVQVIDYWAAE